MASAGVNDDVDMTPDRQTGKCSLLADGLRISSYVIDSQELRDSSSSKNVLLLANGIRAPPEFDVRFREMLKGRTRTVRKYNMRRRVSSFLQEMGVRSEEGTSKIHDGCSKISDSSPFEFFIAEKDADQILPEGIPSKLSGESIQGEEGHDDATYVKFLCLHHLEEALTVIASHLSIRRAKKEYDPSLDQDPSYLDELDTRKRQELKDKLAHNVTRGVEIVKSNRSKEKWLLNDDKKDPAHSAPLSDFPQEHRGAKDWIKGEDSTTDPPLEAKIDVRKADPLPDAKPEDTVTGLPPEYDESTFYQRDATVLVQAMAQDKIVGWTVAAMKAELTEHFSTVPPRSVRDYQPMADTWAEAADRRDLPLEQMEASERVHEHRGTLMNFLVELERKTRDDRSLIKKAKHEALSECLELVLVTCRSYTIINKQRPYFSARDTDFIGRIGKRYSPTMEHEFSDLVEALKEISPVPRIMELIKPVTVAVSYLISDIIASSSLFQGSPFFLHCSCSCLKLGV
jgi:hypothetical protein